MRYSGILAAADISEHCFLAAAHALGQKHDAEGMFELMGSINKKGFPGPLSRNDLPVQLQSAEGTLSLRLSDSILACLETLATGDFLLDVFVTLHQRHGSNLDTIVNGMLFRCAHIPRSDIVRKLLELGADPLVEHNALGSRGRRFVTAVEACLLHGNVEQTIAYIENDRTTAETIASHIAHGHGDKSQDNPYPEASVLLAKTAGSYGNLYRLVSALHKAIGGGPTRAVRARFLAVCLNDWQDHLAPDRLARINELLEPQKKNNAFESIWAQIQRLATQTDCLELKTILDRQTNALESASTVGNP